ncbi:MAG: GNAT family N-acetyltransferase [bacterium]|nr:GNAT family N-acetyltransferase [bacterium]
MLRVSIVGQDRFADCLALRLEVFVDEQKVPLEIEEDGLDGKSTHFLAMDGDTILGTARLRIVNGDGKAERVAVKAVGRRGGVGRALMRAMEAEASRLGAQRMRLNAQVSAIPFYEALGYTAHGPEFGDAGIPHRAMRRDLAATQGG